MDKSFEEIEEAVLAETAEAEGDTLQPLNQVILEEQSWEGINYVGGPGFPISRAEIDTLSEEISALLAGSNRIFNQSGYLVSIENVPHPKLKKVEWRNGEKTKVPAVFPMPVRIKSPHVIGAAQYVGKYWRFDGRKKKWVSVPLPNNLAVQIAVTKAGMFKPLRSVVGHPLLYGGEFRSGYGYDADTSLVYFCDKIEAEVFEDRSLAWDYLREIFDPLPWKTEADFARYIMAMLTCLSAKAECFPAKPIFGFRAPDPNSGKTFATKLIGIVVEGEAPAVMTYAFDKIEQTKAFATAVKSCPTTIVIDNLPNKLKLLDENLNVYSTNEVWETRLLGAHMKLTLPTDPTVMLSGNNWQAVGDTGSRTVFVDLELKGDHDPAIYELEARVTAERLKVLGALQAIVKDAPEESGIDPLRFPEWTRKVAWPVISASGEEDALNFMSEARSEYRVRFGSGCIRHRARANDPRPPELRTIRPDLPIVDRTD